MKKSIVMFVVVAVVLTVSVGAYAHYNRDGHRGGWMSGPQGGMYGGRGGMRGGMYGPGRMQGRGPGKGWGNYQNCPRFNDSDDVRPGWKWNTPGSSETAPQMITEEKVKEVAETYIKQYLPGYMVEKVEKDSWRPMYFVTIKGENGAEMQMFIHGFGGQVMHVIPKTAE